MFKPESQFTYNERLGIPLPDLKKDWELFNEQERAELLLYWEMVRGTIPDHIQKFERMIIRKQRELDHEPNFLRSCRLNSEIAELASCINDLHIWFRLNQDVHAQPKHH
ncbi:hypothetical protein [Paenibacillus turpanensis]|uniref:hypothetical protein n=1 Tax=Paenibacillus turpanensis TaxID=2689078 RepID=UPI001409A8CF|nr:hypothetical protein [Paenibacillus turpanensis]